MRYFIELSYNGKNYHGWQSQPNAISVQEVIEKGLSTLYRRPIEILGAGRTDTGVHAKQMFAHFDSENLIEGLPYKLNAFLPPDIAIQDIFEVRSDAHARFDATERTYEYWITLEKNPFLTESAYWVKRSLDVNRMNEAVKELFNHRDFKCFSRSNTDVKTYHCDIKAAFWKQKDHGLIFTISADRFLRNMVRAVVGTLLDIGLGKLQVEDMKRIIESRDRSTAGASAPAKGLYLTRVVYPESIKNK
ncbi:tRNA pseudouridine(38-40) synthase TruA [Sungkyunkwania multivorans]|uniref:tRNA pseudouridine synthase A n=1 Tax=Sungkyunkwania multivorans TaxID=1173618 RepID=A0ABW3CXH7_9FLAO